MQDDIGPDLRAGTSLAEGSANFLVGRRLAKPVRSLRRGSSRRRRSGLRARPDRLFRHRTGLLALERLCANKPEPLMARGRPEIPPHTNGSESDTRAEPTRRKPSVGAHSEAGTRPARRPPRPGQGPRQARPGFLNSALRKSAVRRAGLRGR